MADEKPKDDKPKKKNKPGLKKPEHRMHHVVMSHGEGIPDSLWSGPARTTLAAISVALSVHSAKAAFIRRDVPILNIAVRMDEAPPKEAAP